MSNQSLSTKQAAKILNVDPQTVRDYVGRGLLPARYVQHGMRWFYKLAEADVIKLRDDLLSGGKSKADTNAEVSQ